MISPKKGLKTKFYGQPSCPKHEGSSHAESSREKKPLPLRKDCSSRTIFQKKSNHRQKFRQELTIKGKITIFSESQGNNESPENNLRSAEPFNCRIVNISSRGIGITIDEELNLCPNDIIIVCYETEANSLEIIKKKAVVRSVDSDYLACEFIPD